MKYVLIAVAVLVAMVLIVVAVGYGLPHQHQATLEATLKTSPQSLYRLITDVDRFPEWRSSVERIERVPDSAGKPRFREIGGDGTILYEVESAVPNERLVTRIADPTLPFGGSWTYELIPRGDSTMLRITEDGEVYNPIYRFVSRFVMGHTATIEKYLNDVRRYSTRPGLPAERTSPHRAPRFEYGYLARYVRPNSRPSGFGSVFENVKGRDGQLTVPIVTGSQFRELELLLIRTEYRTGDRVGGNRANARRDCIEEPTKPRSFPFVWDKCAR